MTSPPDGREDRTSLRERWRPRLARLRRGWSRYTEHGMGVVGMGVLALFVCWALAPDLFTVHSPDWQAYLGTDGGYWTAAQRDSLPHPPAFGDPFWAPLGTNDRGQSVLALVVYAAGGALYIGVVAGLLSSLVGVPLGLVSGYYGDTWVDELIQRVVDVMYGLPFLPFLVVLVAIRGINTTNIVLGIAVTSWLNNCIVVRGETLSLRERAYVDAAKVAGASDARVVFRHVLPNVLPIGFVFLAQDAAAAILAQASLAYLGLADFTTNSWGLMLQNVQATNHVFVAWWWLLPPGLCITAVSAAFYFISFSMEDVTNPQED